MKHFPWRFVMLVILLILSLGITNSIIRPSTIHAASNCPFRTSAVCQNWVVYYTLNGTQVQTNWPLTAVQDDSPQGGPFHGYFYDSNNQRATVDDYEAHDVTVRYDLGNGQNIVFDGGIGYADQGVTYNLSGAFVQRTNANSTVTATGTWHTNNFPGHPAYDCSFIHAAACQNWVVYYTLNGTQVQTNWPLTTINHVPFQPITEEYFYDSNNQRAIVDDQHGHGITVTYNLDNGQTLVFNGDIGYQNQNGAYYNLYGTVVQRDASSNIIATGAWNTNNFPGNPVQ